MRNQISSISLAKPPALVSAPAPTAQAARRAAEVRPDVCTRLPQWRIAPVYAAVSAAVSTSAGLPVFVGVGAGVGTAGVSGAEKTGAYAAEQRVRAAEERGANGNTRVDGNADTRQQDQNKLHLMSRRDLRSWKPPS
jgi:hypothetical protein